MYLISMYGTDSHCDAVPPAGRGAEYSMHVRCAGERPMGLNHASPNVDPKHPGRKCILRVYPEIFGARNRDAEKKRCVKEWIDIR